jgi:hypothetical protein
MIMAEQTSPRARSETLQRIQIGLIGLGAVLLVVAFANVVVRTVRPDAGQTVTVSGQPQGPADQANGTGEPLADLGVMPRSDQSAGPSVPDLEPDPRLSKPMDRDPKKPAGQQR